MQRSDFSRVFVISSFRLQQLPLAAKSAAEPERSPRVRCAELPAKPSPLPTTLRRISGFDAGSRLSQSRRPPGASLFARFSISPQASIRRHLAAPSPSPFLPFSEAPLPPRLGVPSVRAPRGLSPPISAPMPGALRRRSLPELHPQQHRHDLHPPSPRSVRAGSHDAAPCIAFAERTFRIS